ncbi:chorismate-binding protein [Cellulosimicrobium protaetiae]|uniref:Chorismate-utilising enzyme C-terminal domain-containing protein n=1 Tax=Cellulosimicrobium protaetiae TaxID=2587808 RepID=A0A6M5U8K3_9MICO|nr:chorismate-binding protein [Cellulosimicrobium protaetiae]QJW34846.1 hypothetical protein FIC82_000150 [Cellulosimicrobium protaetiae]
MTIPLPPGLTAQDLLRGYEHRFGPAFLYGQPSAGTSSPRVTVLTTCERTWWIDQVGSVVDGRRVPGSPTESFDRALTAVSRVAAGPAWVPDVVFALSYDLVWPLRAARGLSSRDAPGALAFVARPGHPVLVDEAAGQVRCLPPDRAVVEELAERSGRRARPGGTLTEFVERVDEVAYRRQFSDVQRHLARGEVYQLLVSAEARVRARVDRYEYFAEVCRRYRDASFSYRFHGQDGLVLGACSLPHVHVDGSTVRTRVFAGTQPSSGPPSAVSAAERALAEDPRFFAEHAMLVDVERNDLATICEPGSVVVERFMEPLAVGPTIYLASDVRGTVREDVSTAETVLANFPRGVGTGAPKARAQEVLDDIETSSRRHYTGVVGTVSEAGARVRSTTVVTCASEDEEGVLSLRCGGGIVSGSTPDAELAELHLKMSALV